MIHRQLTSIKKTVRESGNALFLILIAIFLLGGLSVLVSRTSGDSEDTGSSEQASIKASSLMRYGSGLEVAVQTLLSRGCSENQISFWWDSNNDGNETAADLYYNPNAPTKRQCHVFRHEGTGLSRPVFQGLTNTSFAFSMNTIRSGDNNKHQGTSRPEMVYLQRFDNDSALCRQINRNLSNTISIFEGAGAHNQSRFVGTMTDASSGISVAGAGTTLAPISGCFCNGGLADCSNSTEFWFYKTLIKR